MIAVYTISASAIVALLGFVAYCIASGMRPPSERLQKLAVIFSWAGIFLFAASIVQVLAGLGQ